jgi:hypothetical protein
VCPDDEKITGGAAPGRGRAGESHPAGEDMHGGFARVSCSSKDWPAARPHRSITHPVAHSVRRCFRLRRQAMSD